jgi:bifunctional DNase/RNase
MKMKELKILGLSYSKTQVGQFVLVLGQKRGPLKLPIIIKENEAQYIAIKLESIKSQKPSIFDVFKTLTDTLQSDVYQVVITHILEGIFHTKISVSNMIEEFEIPCSIGDAICLSVTYGCKIYCSDEVLKLAGIQMDDDGTITDEQQEENVGKSRDYKSVLSLEDLEKLLSKAVENEEYEIASQIRDRISEIKEKTK